ncbi:MAG TPA: PAS domain-containing protein [Acetobacteraceae bacterium]|nr:PAS domain-containing protein [Acetobacteraceae bacterium]
MAPLTSEQLFQALGDCAYELDSDFRFLTYNAGCEAYYGCPISQALGRPIWEALPQTRGSPLEPLLRSSMAARRPLRVEMAGVVHPDRWIEVTLFPTQRGLGVAFRDRTADRRAAQALRDHAERLRLIVESARDYAIFTTDAEGRIDTWWPGAAAVFGWAAEEMVGQPVEVTYTPDDQAAGVPAQEREAARREGAAPNVRWHLRKDGSRVFIEGSATALRGPDGGIRGFLKIGQDITERKAAEERQSLLAREVDHRARNSLAMVQGMMRLTQAETIEEFTRVVSGRVDALARVHSLLADDRWRGADLRILLRQELEPYLAAGHGPRAALEGRPLMLPPGAAQPVAMIIHELATNAAKYGALSAPEGRVSIEWTSERDVLRLRWTELGGPAVACEPERRGFGSTMIEAAVAQLDGTLSRAWHGTGLVCEFAVSIGG